MSDPPAQINISTTSNSSASGGWFSWVPSAMAAVPDLTTAIFGESKSDMDNLKEDIRSTEHQKRRMEINSERERKLAETWLREETLLKNKGITDSRLRNAITKRMAAEANATRLDAAVARLQNVISALNNTSVDFTVLSAVGNMTSSIASVNQVLDNNNSAEMSALFQKQMLQLETRLQMIESSLDNGNTPAESSVNDEYERAKREIELNQTLAAKAQTTSHSNSTASAAAPAASSEQEDLEARLRQLKSN